MQTEAHDLPDAGRRHERAAVVELHAARHAMACPQRVQATDDLVATIDDDLDPGVTRAHVDLVERMKAYATIEMTRTDEIDLDDVARPVGGRRRIRDALGRPASRPRPARRTGASQDPLDRALGRHDRTELLS